MEFDLAGASMPEISYAEGGDLAAADEDAADGIANALRFLLDL